MSLLRLALFAWCVRALLPLCFKPTFSSRTPLSQQDILKDQWSPALTIKTAMLSLQAMLSTPEPDDPQDAEVAAMYKSDINTFNNTAKFWTESYAAPREMGADAAVGRLCEMGFGEAQAKEALEANGGNEEAALNALLGGA
jgi:ubiquitin-conjugating enzyme (huntingtin interacting protein 2)